MRAPALLLTALISAAAAQEPSLPCNAGDKACAFAAAKQHVSKKAEFWKGALDKPLEQRIGPAPAELIELLALDNISHGYPNKPRSSRLTPEFLADVQKAFAGIPLAVKRRLRDKLAGIYFIDDIGGTGFTEQVEEASGEAKIGFIVLDPSVLMEHTANSWATWKDASPFKPDKAWSLEARIENGAHDNRANAIQYILLHELGHVLSIGAGILPSWSLSPKEVGPTRGFSYFEQSWKIVGDSYATVFDASFPQRRDVVFYFGPKLEAGAMRATYSALERTSFPTLYAATHPGDDFAEAFANYVHVVLLRKPFEIRLARDGRVVKTYRACWDAPRCRAKQEFLARFLGV